MVNGLNTGEEAILGPWTVVENGTIFTVDKDGALAERTVVSEFDFNADHRYNGIETFSGTAIFEGEVKDKRALDIDLFDTNVVDTKDYTETTVNIRNTGPSAGELFVYLTEPSSNTDSAGRPVYQRYIFTSQENTADLSGINIVAQQNMYINGKPLLSTTYRFENVREIMCIRFTDSNGAPRWNIFDTLALTERPINFEALPTNQSSNAVDGGFYSMACDSGFSIFLDLPSNITKGICLVTSYESEGSISLSCTSGQTVRRNNEGTFGTNIEIPNGAAGFILPDLAGPATYVYFDSLNSAETYEQIRVGFTNSSQPSTLLGGREQVSSRPNSFIITKTQPLGLSQKVNLYNAVYYGSTGNGTFMDGFVVDNSLQDLSYSPDTEHGLIDELLRVTGLKTSADFQQGDFVTSQVFLQAGLGSSFNAPYVRLANFGPAASDTNELDLGFFGASAFFKNSFDKNTIS